MIFSVNKTTIEEDFPHFGNKLPQSTRTTGAALPFCFRKWRMHISPVIYKWIQNTMPWIIFDDFFTLLCYAWYLISPHSDAQLFPYISLWFLTLWNFCVGNCCNEIPSLHAERITARELWIGSEIEVHYDVIVPFCCTYKHMHIALHHIPWKRFGAEIGFFTVSKPPFWICSDKDYCKMC